MEKHHPDTILLMIKSMPNFCALAITFFRQRWQTITHHLQLIKHPCHMETIAHRMMDLHRERQQHFSILFVVFAKREHWGKEVLHMRNIHRKVRKRYPRNRRDEKDVFTGLFLRPV